MINRREFSVASASTALLAASGCATPGAAPLSSKSVGDVQNYTPVLTRRIAEAIASGAPEVRLPSGELHLWPEGGTERFLHVSNNDDRDYLIAGLIEGADGLHIRGDNTRIICHGMMAPFVVQSSRNVRFSGISIDWAIPFHCEGRVDAVDAKEAKWIELTIPEQFRYEIRDGTIVLLNEGYEQVGLKRILEFNAARRETEYMVFDNGFTPRGVGAEPREHTVTAIAKSRIRIDVAEPFVSPPKIGNMVILMPTKRYAPTFFLENTDGVRFDDVTIHHAGCMGIIAQTSKDITLNRLNVTPSRDRLVSTCVDATHFVNCSGTITVQDGLFSNHIDDAVNVHGIYVPITEKIGPRALVARYTEYQHRGVRTIRKGDLISISDAQTVEAIFTAKVESAMHRDAEFVQVTLNRDLPPGISAGDVINTLNRQANLVLRGNDIGKNRARGILVSTGGMVLVEENRFHSPGTAIRISGGVDHWYESGPTNQVMIRKNLFDHCKYGVWGNSIIDIVCVDTKSSESTAPFHEAVIVEDNTFRTEHGDLVYAYRLGTLAFTNNRIVVEPYLRTNAQTQTPFELKSVSNFILTNNTVAGYSWPVFEHPNKSAMLKPDGAQQTV